MELAIALVMLLTYAGMQTARGGGRYWWVHQTQGPFRMEISSSSSSSSSSFQQGSTAGGGSGGCCGGYQYGAQREATPQIDTECRAGKKCVNVNFCDGRGFISSYRVGELNGASQRQQQKCMVNPARGLLGVCCAMPPTQIIIQQQQQPKQQQHSRNQGSFQGIRNQGQVFNNQICPPVGQLPPVQQCSGRISTCWSEGQLDVDCPDNGPCCFDGCANTCLSVGGSINIKQQQQHQQQQQQQPVVAPVQSTVIQTNPRAYQANVQHQLPNRREQPQLQQRTSSSYGLSNQPEKQPNIQTYQQPRVPEFNSQVGDGSFRQTNEGQYHQASVPQQQLPSRAEQQQQRQTSSSYGASVQSQRQPTRRTYQQSETSKYNPQSSGSSLGHQNADSIPFVTCPSAMLCVEKRLCDFNGVIDRSNPLDLSLQPHLESLRVPLIPCINPVNRNTDVCCRDPDYKDPWPKSGSSMMGRNFQMASSMGSNPGD